MDVACRGYNRPDCENSFYLCLKVGDGSAEQHECFPPGDGAGQPLCGGTGAVALPGGREQPYPRPRGLLGARLLNRTARQLTLTEAGEEFRKRCEVILSEVSEAEAAALSLQATPRGILRLSVPTTFAIRHLGPVIAGFLDRYAQMQIDAVLSDRIVDLIEEGFDLAVRIGDLPDSRLMARRIAPCRFVVCASPVYLERHGAPKQPSDLAKHHCLEYCCGLPDGTLQIVTARNWLYRSRDASRPRMEICCVAPLSAASVSPWHPPLSWETI